MSGSGFVEVELEIEGLAADGDGVGRDAEGRAVFVPFTAPGDRVRARLGERRTRFARGRAEVLLVESPQRAQPVCPVFGSCGGCRWQHVAYEHQLAAKAQRIEDALARLAHLRAPGPIAVRPSPSPYAYRSRTRVLIRGGRVGYRRRRSHALCPVWRCPVLVEPLDERLAALAGEPPGRDGEWELAAGRDRVRAGPPDARGPRLEIELAGDRIGFSPGVFTQSNALLIEPLARAVAAAAGSGDLALELFAGAGFLSLGLARRFERLVVVESDPRALRDLRHNLAAAGLTNVALRSERVGARPPRGLPRAPAPDAVVLDPPRSGLPAGAAHWLAALGAARIVYLSCDPATLARDLASLAGEGYALRRLEGFDLFPQTPHVEVLAVAERAGAAVGAAG